MRFFTQKTYTNVFYPTLSADAFFNGTSCFKQDLAMVIDSVLFRVDIALY